jgi:hypothetical protein
MDFVVITHPNSSPTHPVERAGGHTRRVEVASQKNQSARHGRLRNGACPKTLHARFSPSRKRIQWMLTNEFSMTNKATFWLHRANRKKSCSSRNGDAGKVQRQQKGEFQNLCLVTDCTRTVRGYAMICISQESAQNEHFDAGIDGLQRFEVVEKSESACTPVGQKSRANLRVHANMRTATVERE